MQAKAKHETCVRASGFYSMAPRCQVCLV